MLPSATALCVGVHSFQPRASTSCDGRLRDRYISSKQAIMFLSVVKCSTVVYIATQEAPFPILHIHTYTVN